MTDHIRTSCRAFYQVLSDYLEGDLSTRTDDVQRGGRRYRVDADEAPVLG